MSGDLRCRAFSSCVHLIMKQYHTLCQGFKFSHISSPFLFVRAPSCISPEYAMLLLKTVSLSLDTSLSRSVHSHLWAAEQTCTSSGKASSHFLFSGLFPPPGIPDGPSLLPQTSGFRDPATPAEDWNSHMGFPRCLVL